MLEQGAQVDVVMTEAATRFITTTTMQALSGRPVLTDTFDARVPNSMAHITLTRGADAVLVAPASTNFMARLAHGLAEHGSASGRERGWRYGLIPGVAVL